MPQYPPLGLASQYPSYWQVNLAITTPVGLVAGAIALQPMPDGTGTALISSRLYNYDPVMGVWNGGKILRANAYYDQVINNVARYGPNWISGGYQNVGPGADEEHFGSLPSYDGPDYLIGINVGIRRGGRLGCNISIGYLPASGRAITQFWQQDVSYYRLWKLALPVPPVVHNPNPDFGNNPKNKPLGWNYVLAYPGTFSDVFFPFPTIYYPDAVVRYGGGAPVWATQNSEGLGQLFQKQWPSQANLDLNDAPSYVDEDIWQQGVDAYQTNTVESNSVANKYAFIGDVFQAPPYNYICAANPLLMAWFQQALGDDYYCACVAQRSIYGNSDANYYGAAGLMAVGAPYYVSNNTDFPPGWTFLPGYNINAIDPAFGGNYGFAPMYAANPGGPISFGQEAAMPALLPQLGVPLGLGCTAYCLNVIEVQNTSPPPPPPPPPPCNIRIVQTQYVTSYATHTPYTIQLACALNNPVTAGNTLLVVVRGENNQSITVSDSQGNVYVADVIQDSQSEYILSIWRTTIFANGQLTVTITTPPTFPAGGPIGITFDLMEVAGLAASPLAGTDYRTGAQGNVWVGSNLAVCDNCDLLIASCISAFTSLQSYPGAPWTTLEPGHAEDPTGDTVWQETHGLVIGPSAYWTLQEALPWTAIMAAYKTS